MLRAILDQILSWFDVWKGIFLSYTGRLCQLNFVITSAFMHSFMIYQWLLGLVSDMQKAMRNFLWLAFLMFQRVFMLIGSSVLY